MLTDIKEQLEKLYSLLYDEQVQYIWEIRNELRDNVYSYLENSKAAQDKLYSLIEKFNTDFNNKISDFKFSFDDYSKYAKDKLMLINSHINNCSTYLFQIRDYLSKLTEWYYPQNLVYSGQSDYVDMRYGWRAFFTSFSGKSFQSVLLDVHQQIEDATNPLSENNKESFDAAITNFNENTFIGSANELITTFPGELTNALTKDSSPVLQFKTAAVSNSYFTLPARTFSIDFSWYAPFKGTADTLISAFIYIGFIIAFIKRLPEILHGAGIIRDSYVDFQDAQFNNDVANDTYQYLVDNGGYDDLSF